MAASTPSALSTGCTIVQLLGGLVGLLALWWLNYASDLQDQFSSFGSGNGSINEFHLLGVALLATGAGLVVVGGVARGLVRVANR